MKKKIEIDIEIPSIPNFFRSKDQNTAISIKDCTKAELQAIGEEWTKQLIKKAISKKRLS